MCILKSLIISSLFLVGCAKTSTYQQGEIITYYKEDGKTVDRKVDTGRIHLRTFTFFDANNNLTKAKVMKNDKTASISIGESITQSSVTNLAAEIIKGMKSSQIP